MLTVKDLTVAYADTPVFADVAVHFNAGKITGIIGPNGAGKSTLIKAILGSIKVQSGTVDFSGRTLKEVQQSIAYVEQRKDLDLTFLKILKTDLGQGVKRRLSFLFARTFQ